MERAAVGVVNPTVVLLAPTVADRVVEPLPCSARDWPVDPIVSAPPGVIDNAPVLCNNGVVTLVENVGLLVIDNAPSADKLKLPLAETANVPVAFGIVST